MRGYERAMGNGDVTIQTPPEARVKHVVERLHAFARKRPRQQPANLITYGSTFNSKQTCLRSDLKCRHAHIGKQTNAHVKPTSQTNHASDNHAYDRPQLGPWAKTIEEWQNRKARRLSLLRGVHTSTVTSVTKRPPKVNTMLGTGMMATSHGSAPNTW